MIRYLLPALLALLALTSSTAVAAARDDIGLPSCDPDGTMPQLNACASDALAAANAELNAVYRQIMATLPDGSVARANLRAAQRQWIVLRDADLKAIYPLEPGEDARMMYGSLYPMSLAYTQVELTRERTQWLRRHFLENDG